MTSPRWGLFVRLGVVIAASLAGAGCEMLVRVDTDQLPVPTVRDAAIDASAVGDATASDGDGSAPDLAADSTGFEGGSEGGSEVGSEGGPDTEMTDASIAGDSAGALDGDIDVVFPSDLADDASLAPSD